MYNEYNHLRVLSKKYNLSDFTIGLLRGCFLYQMVSLISFENFIKEYVAYESREWKRYVLDYYFRKQEDFIKNL